MIDRFFIIGSPRSGTTLFRLMLNKNSDIVVPPEAGFLVWLYNEFSNFSYSEENTKIFIKKLKLTKKIENLNIDFNLLSDYINLTKPNSYSELIDAVYEFYASKIINKNITLYGDKNNYYLEHIDLLHQLYSHAKFIHIIRDGRSVAVSYIDLMKKELKTTNAPKLPIAIENIANEWNNNIGFIESSFKKLHTDLHMTIRFEDLIENPKATLQKVCGFLNVEFESSMLEYWKTTEKDGLEPEEYGAWKEKNLLPIQKEEVYKYKKLSEEEMNTFHKCSESILKKYLYF